MDHNQELRDLLAKSPTEGIKVKNFFRINIEKPGGFGIAGDSGWQENIITQEGFRNLVRLLGNIAGSSQITHVALGTGGIPSSTATSLAGEVQVRAAINAASNGSTALQLTATFASSDNFVTDERYISNIGCFATSTAGAGTMFAGNTYASSSCNTNQNVNITYNWTFS